MHGQAVMENLFDVVLIDQLAAPRTDVEILVVRRRIGDMPKLLPDIPLLDEFEKTDGPCVLRLWAHGGWDAVLVAGPYRLVGRRFADYAASAT